MNTQLFVRNRDGTIEKELDVFTQFDCIKRFNKPGSWAVKCPDSEAARLLTEPGRGLVVIRGDAGDETTLISGPMWKVAEEWEDDTLSFVISGFSDDIALWDRLVFPCAPTSLSGFVLFPDAATDQRRGAAETVMHAYVVANCLDPTRNVPGMQDITLGEDLGRGADVVESARFATLGDLLASIGIHGGGLGFQVAAEFVGTEIAPLIFNVYEPVDRTDEQVFSVETGNIESYKASYQAPTATRVITAGAFEGTLRRFGVASDDALAAKWGRHVEAFVDQRQTDDVVELYQKAQETLSDKGEKVEFSFRPIDVPNRTFGKHYGLGDRVTEPHDGAGLLAEVAFTLDADGEVIEPSSSSTTTATTNALARLDDHIRELRKRSELLERSV